MQPELIAPLANAATIERLQRLGGRADQRVIVADGDGFVVEHPARRRGVGRALS
jgi:hypothetical protein